MSCALGTLIALVGRSARLLSGQRSSIGLLQLILAISAVGVVVDTALASATSEKLNQTFAAGQGVGFVCTGVDQDVRFEIDFASTHDQQGPRVQTMSIFDPYVSKRHSLIARFSSADGLLNYTGGAVIATVDLAHPDSSRRGERIGGTLLGALRLIVVEIDFSFEQRALNGVQLGATATYIKNNGEQLTQDLDCVRHASDKRTQVANWIE